MIRTPSDRHRAEDLFVCPPRSIGTIIALAWDCNPAKAPARTWLTYDVRLSTPGYRSVFRRRPCVTDVTEADGDETDERRHGVRRARLDPERQGCSGVR